LIFPFYLKARLARDRAFLCQNTLLLIVSPKSRAITRPKKPLKLPSDTLFLALKNSSSSFTPSVQKQAERSE
jgi:hypothetical protein